MLLQLPVFRTLNLAPDIEYIFLNVPLHIIFHVFTHRRRPRATFLLCPPAAPCPQRTPPRRLSRPRASDRWTVTRKMIFPTASTLMRMTPLLLCQPYLTRSVSVAGMTMVTHVRRKRFRIPSAASAETLRAPSRRCRSEPGRKSFVYWQSIRINELKSLKDIRLEECNFQCNAVVVGRHPDFVT